MTPQPRPPSHQGLYATTLEAAVNLGVAAVPRLVMRARKSLVHQVVDRMATPGVSAPIDPGYVLERHMGELADAFGDALWHEFGAELSLGLRPGWRAGAAGAPAARPAAGFSFDSLELMSEDQVDETIEFVRARQLLASVTDHHLPPFTALICAVQGLEVARVSANPLQPDAWLRALRTAVFRCPYPDGQRARLLHHLNSALAIELAAIYDQLVADLRARGVRPAGFSLGNTAPEPGPAEAGSPASAANAVAGLTPRGPAGAPAAPAVDPLLNLRSLWHLMAGHGVPSAPANGAAAGTGPREFADLTVPAALEAVQEMNQVDALMRRIADRPELNPFSEARRDGQALTPTQALSLEVVKLMLDHLVADQRLLEPVRRALRELEPALGCLALCDPRFFTHKAHPARVLIDEIVQRSLAWSSVDASGFAPFLDVLRQGVGALTHVVIDSAEPFEKALAVLQDAWRELEKAELERRVRAHQMLIRAVERNALARSLATDWGNRPEVTTSAEPIQRFLKGPWSQVVAAARLADRHAGPDPGGYLAVIDDLLWSALPHPGKADLRRLSRLVPGMLHTLRAGLSSIDYPPEATAQFLDELADIHQAAFRAQPAPPPRPAREAVEAMLADKPGDEIWLAPAEARASGFMGIDTLSQPAALPSGPDTLPSAPLPPPAAEGEGASFSAGLRAGDWLDIFIAGAWTRCRLLWVSPESNLFMFAQGSGQSHSMSGTLLDRMASLGAARLITEVPSVDRALDSVAQAALRNSL